MPYPAKTSPDAILEAARTLLEGGGPEGLSMRSLAGQLGLRASSLYRHYPDKTALEAALEDDTAAQLHAAMRGASARQQGADALHSAAHAYLAYAREHPKLYALLHAPRPPAVAQPGAGKDLWNLVLSLVGGITGDPDDTAGAVALWSFLHGFVSLERGGAFGLSGPRGGFERGLKALVAGLRQEA